MIFRRFDEHLDVEAATMDTLAYLAKFRFVASTVPGIATRSGNRSGGRASTCWNNEP